VDEGKESKDFWCGQCKPDLLKKFKSVENFPRIFQKACDGVCGSSAFTECGKCVGGKSRETVESGILKRFSS